MKSWFHRNIIRHVIHSIELNFNINRESVNMLNIILCTWFGWRTKKHQYKDRWGISKTSTFTIIACSVMYVTLHIHINGQNPIFLSSDYFIQYMYPICLEVIPVLILCYLKLHVFDMCQHTCLSHARTIR